MTAKPRRKTSQAPTGRNNPAQGNALGRAAPQNQSPEGAGQSIWPIMALSDVCTKISDGTHHSPTVQHSEAAPGRFKYITSKNIRPWGLDLGDIAYLDEDVHREIYSRCNPELGDVLLTKDGANTGNVAINTLEEEFSLLSSVALLKLKRDILDSRFVRYYLESPVGSKRLLGDMTGTAIRRIILRKIKETEIPVAPPDDQRRIVAEIEKQFTRLEAGVAALRRVQANLKRYRAAVLAAACEGRLVPTEAELCGSGVPPLNPTSTAKLASSKAGSKVSKSPKRQDAASTFESGQQLLARILTERRQNWQGRGKYKEPVAPDAAKLPAIPDGWTWASFDQVTTLITKGSSPNWQGFNYCNDGIIFVRSENVRWGLLDLDGVAHLPPAFNEKERKSILREGDVLLNLVGASIGRAAIATAEVDGGNVNQAVAVIRFVSRKTMNQFAMLWLNSIDGQKRIHAEKVDVARANFSLEDHSSSPAPPPTPRRTNPHRGGSGAAVERGGGTGSRGHHQPPARHPPAAVRASEGIHWGALAWLVAQEQKTRHTPDHSTKRPFREDR